MLRAPKVTQLFNWSNNEGSFYFSRRCLFEAVREKRMQPRIRLTTISQSVRETKRPNPLLMESLLLIAMTGPSGTVPQSPQTVSAHKQIRLRRRQTRKEERRREKKREDERRREKTREDERRRSAPLGVEAGALALERREEKRRLPPPVLKQWASGFQSSCSSSVRRRLGYLSLV